MINYKYIDLFKLFFALLIPFLHISFPNNYYIEVVRQYFSRLGVPFFFSCTGVMLCILMEKGNKQSVCIKYIKRIGYMLFFWTFIYSPLFYKELYYVEYPFRELLFRTPGFLWYLTAVLFAIIPFVYVQRNILYFSSIFIYIYGVWYSESYCWLNGGCLIYQDIFLTTRNGLFFGIPLMCIGELAYKTYDKIKYKAIKMLLSTIVLFSEITYVRNYVPGGADTSLYFSLPIFIFYLFINLFAIENLLPINILSIAKIKILRKMSSTIYVVQYGIIITMTSISSRLEIINWYIPWMTYFVIILFSLALCTLAKKYLLLNKVI